MTIVRSTVAPAGGRGVDLDLDGEFLLRVTGKPRFGEQRGAADPRRLHRFAVVPANRTLEPGEVKVALQLLQPAARAVSGGRGKAEVEVFGEARQALEQAQRGAADERHRLGRFAFVQRPQDEDLQVFAQGVEALRGVRAAQGRGERLLLHSSSPSSSGR